MSNESELLCRTCLKTSDTCELFDFSMKEHNFSEFETILDLFRAYVDLKINEEDIFMPYICQECYEFLVNFHIFHKMCINSNLELLKLKYSVDNCSVPIKRIEVEDSSDVQHGSQIEYEISDDSSNVHGGGNELPEDIEANDETLNANTFEHVTEPAVPVRDNQFEQSAAPVINLTEDDDDMEIVYNNLNQKIGYAKLHKCEVCGSSVSLRHLKAHMNLHTKQRKYPCEFCSNVYFSRNSVHSHRKRKHHMTKNENFYQCNLCNIQFDNLSEAKQHLALHSDEDGTEQNELVGVYLDPEQQMFVNYPLEMMAVDENGDDLNESNLMIHGLTEPPEENLATETNTAEKLYGCDLCPKFYHHSASLWRHRTVTHHVKKNKDTFVCVFCDTTYADANEILQHVETCELKPSNKGQLSEVPSEGVLRPDETMNNQNELTVIDLESDQEMEMIVAEGNTIVSNDSNSVTNDVIELLEDNQAPETNTSVRQLNCEFCPKVYYVSNSLLRHRIRTHHIKKTKNVFYCTACDAGYLDTNEVLQHVSTCDFIAGNRTRPSEDLSSEGILEQESVFEENQFLSDNDQTDNFKTEF